MKFSLDWLGDFVDVGEAGGAAGVRTLLDQAGIPIESVARFEDDAILDAEITPNRPDAMGHRGLAREIAAMSGLAPRDLGDRYAEPSTRGEATEHLTSLVLQVPRHCRRFGARLVRGVEDATAPARVRERLAAIGAKSISAAVDATNYVLWDTGQPLHAFDFDRLAGGLLIVRRARRGERLVTLDGVERVLESSDIVVADAERAVSLAGIMGGLDTAVTASTRNVLLEAAWWDPVTIRRTARRLGMHTDASHRFERGADPDAIPAALNLAARILLEAAGGTVAPGYVDVHGAALRVRKTALRLSRLRMLSGDSRIGIDFAGDALRRLGFATEAKGKRISVQIPLFRADVRREDDLVEEVLRVWGYDRLPTRLPPSTLPGGQREPLRAVEERLADAAAAAGFFETVGYPFVDRAGDEGAWEEWLRATGTAAEPLSIENPLDATRRHLRATLLPGLLDAVSRNVRHGADGVALFEIGRAFGAAGDTDHPESFESRRLAFALAGERRDHWSTPEKLRAADFFDAKGLVERLVEPWIAPEDLTWRPMHVQALATGAAAAVEAPGGAVLGVVGLVAEEERRRRDLSVPVFAGEILVSALPAAARAYEFHDAPLHPAVVADLTFAQPRELAWSEIAEFVRRRGIENLESFRCHDRYEDPKDPAGRVKTTVRLVFRSAGRTLSQQEVNEAVARLAREMEAELGVEP
ncbi:MAG TPA: phenylalanine--tRNA ligase subunit beta [Thermoanaerobaculia bacterium]|nr:phenylalanine--tRNA ligase subunit beta [Thermoanaerobaculia bacterium]